MTGSADGDLRIWVGLLTGFIRRRCLLVSVGHSRFIQVDHEDTSSHSCPCGSVLAHVITLEACGCRP